MCRLSFAPESQTLFPEEVILAHCPPRPEEGNAVRTPTVDFTDYLALRDTHADHQLPVPVLAQCREAWNDMHEVGLIAGFDPRVDPVTFDRQLEMFLAYHYQPAWKKWGNVGTLNFQVGTTPPYVEYPLPYEDWLASLAPEDMPRPILPGTDHRDPKWREMFPVGPRLPAEVLGRFAEALNNQPMVPVGFPEWPEVMNASGDQLLSSTFVLLEMLAIGAGLPRDTFADICTNGSHLLGPTASNLSELHQPGLVLAGRHDDLGFITAHSRSNLPGLRAWTRSGRRFNVKVPRGYLLWQGAQEFQWVTGGHIHCGMHEVIVPVDEADQELIRQARLAAHAVGHDLWRVTTTLFCHACSVREIYPLPAFATPEAEAQYPHMLAGDHLLRGIAKIGLVASQAKL